MLDDFDLSALAGLQRFALFIDGSLDRCRAPDIRDAARGACQDGEGLGTLEYLADARFLRHARQNSRYREDSKRPPDLRLQASVDVGDLRPL
jgi:hypothetical protein